MSVNYAEPVAGAISTSHSVAYDLQQQNPDTVASKSHSEFENEHTRNELNSQQKMPERIVYVSQPSLRSDTRVTNVMQGREFHETNNILKEEVQSQNKVSDRVIYFTQKMPGSDSKNLNEMQESKSCVTNTMSERVVYVKSNKPENIVNLQITPSECPNTVQERVVYVQQVVTGSNVNLLDETTKVAINDPNQIPVRIVYGSNEISESNMNMPYNTSNVHKEAPVRVVYVPQNIPGDTKIMQNDIPGITIQSPYNMQRHVQIAPFHMRSRTPSPSRTQDRALEVAQQAINLAANISKQDDDEEIKNVGNFVYIPQPIAEPAMYSPYMMGAPNGFMPQMQYPVGCMPTMQNNPYMMQKMLQQQAYMPVTNLPHYITPSPQPVQEGHYQSSSPFFDNEGSIMQQEFDTSQALDAPDTLPELPDIDLDIINENCCSWFDCFCGFFGNNE